MASPARQFSALRYLPHSVAATAAGLVAPSLLAPRLLALAGWSAPIWADALTAVALYWIASTAGSWLWHRLPGTRQVAFGELMLWSWFRLARSERRLVEATRLLGFGRDGVRRSDADVSPERQRQLLRRLNDALEAKDLYTVGHTRRVSRHSYWIAKKMRLGLAEVEKVRVAADVHDVGKVMVPDAILRKPGKLTDEEYEVMKRHSAVGAELSAGLGDERITAIVRAHHERWDGTGYPDRLTRTDIPLGARIIAVADTYDAITTTRSYRSKAAHRKAVRIIRAEAGKQFDPTIVRVFLSHKPQRATGGALLLAHAPGTRLLEWLTGLLRSAASASVTGAAAVGGAAVIGASFLTPGVWPLDGSHALADPVHASPSGGEASAPAASGGEGSPGGSRSSKTRDRSRPGAHDGPGRGGGGAGDGGGEDGGGPGSSGGGGDVPSPDPGPGGSGGSDPELPVPVPDLPVPVPGLPVPLPELPVPVPDLPELPLPELPLPELPLPELPLPGLPGLP